MSIFAFCKKMSVFILLADYYFRQIAGIHMRWDPNTAKQSTRMIPFTEKNLPQNLIPGIFLYNYNELIVFQPF